MITNGIIDYSDIRFAFSLVYPNPSYIHAIPYPIYVIKLCNRSSLIKFVYF